MVGIEEVGVVLVVENDGHGGIGRRLEPDPKAKVKLTRDKPSILQPKDLPEVADAKGAKADKEAKPSGDPKPKAWRVFIWVKPEGLVMKLIDGPLDPLPEAAKLEAFDVKEMPTLYVRNNGSWVHIGVARIVAIDADEGCVTLVLDKGVEAVDVPLRKRTATGGSANGSAKTATSPKAKK